MKPAASAKRPPRPNNHRTGTMTLVPLAEESEFLFPSPLTGEPVFFPSPARGAGSMTDSLTALRAHLLLQLACSRKCREHHTRRGERTFCLRGSSCKRKRRTRFERAAKKVTGVGTNCYRDFENASVRMNEWERQSPVEWICSDPACGALGPRWNWLSKF